MSTVDLQTWQALRKLCMSLLAGSGSPSGVSFPLITRQIPNDISADRTKGSSLYLTGDHARKYTAALSASARDMSLEYLSRDTLDRDLWHLVCELAFASGVEKSQVAFAKKVEEFLAKRAKPLVEYEILFPVDYLSVGEMSIKVGGVEIIRLEADSLKSMGMHDKAIGEFGGKTFVRLPSPGTRWQLAIERARSRAVLALDLVR